MKRETVDLVLSGGGSHVVGIASAGCALNARHDVVRVGGASAGAIAAAAIAVGMSTVEVRDAIKRVFTGKDLADLSFNPLHRFGLHGGGRLRSALRDVFGDVGFDDTLIPLKVVACDLYTRQPVVLDNKHADHRKLQLVDVLMASAAIPGFFKACHLPEAWGNRLFVDGGTAKNSPFSIMDDNPRATFGVRVRQEDDGEMRPVRSLGSYASAIAELLMWSSNNAHVPTKQWHDTMTLVVNGSGLKMKLTTDEVDERWAQGYTQARRWMDERTV